jgi:ABC-type transport system involved in multi-copper enzyme maturation permease subunit
MKKVLIIGKYTLKENISNKVFNGILYFGILTMFFTTMLDEVALYEGGRVIKDSGLFLTEALIMLITVYISSTYVIKAVEEKSIYLVLTKAVSKSKYIMGINLGIIYSVFVNVFIMGGILGIIMYTKGELDWWYIRALFFIALKLSIVSSLGVFFSVISDSFVTATIFTLFTYILGHAVLEIKAISVKFAGTMFQWVLDGLYIILPKFNLLNYRDYLIDPHINYFMIIGYVIVYITCIVVATIIVFDKKRL